jgi:drug/metabolite transporter (DMT)-like permease
MTATGAVRTYRTVALPRERNIGLILAAGTAVISGISVFVNATAVKAVPDPAVFTTLKNLIAVAILFGLAMAVVRPAEVRGISGRDRSMLGAIGVLGGGVAFLLFFSGLAMASAPTAAFIHKTMFIWVALMAGPFLTERLDLRRSRHWLVAGRADPHPAAAWHHLGDRRDPDRDRHAHLGRGSRSREAGPRTGPFTDRRCRSARDRPRRAVRVPTATGRIAGIADLGTTGWTWVAVTGVLLAGYVGTWMAALRRAPATEVTSILVLGALITAALTVVSRGVAPEPVTSAGYLLALLGVAGLLLVGRRVASAPTPAVA